MAVLQSKLAGWESRLAQPKSAVVPELDSLQGSLNEALEEVPVEHFSKIPQASYGG